MNTLQAWLPALPILIAAAVAFWGVWAHNPPPPHHPGPENSAAGPEQCLAGLLDIWDDGRLPYELRTYAPGALPEAFEEARGVLSGAEWRPVAKTPFVPKCRICGATEGLFRDGQEWSGRPLYRCPSRDCVPF